LEDAEILKRGEALQEEIKHPRKRLDEIIEARLSDIFDLVGAHLKKINKAGLLPAGIIITGGGSGILTIDDFAKAYLKLPSSVARVVCDETKQKCITNSAEVKDASWAVAYGLTLFGLNSEGNGSISSNFGMRMARAGKNKVVNWVRQFLP